MNKEINVTKITKEMLSDDDNTMLEKTLNNNFKVFKEEIEGRDDFYLGRFDGINKSLKGLREDVSIIKNDIKQILDCLKNNPNKNLLTDNYDNTDKAEK